MPSRQRSRRKALQMLFERDLRGVDPDQAIAHYYQMHAGDGDEETERDEYAEGLVRGTAANQEGIDARIQTKSAQWKLQRMPVVDRNILRLCIFEMTQGGVPAPVAIDEAMQLARRFSSDESLSFINGLLDAVGREATAPSVQAATNPE